MLTDAVEFDDVVAGTALIDRAVSRLADLLALTHGGAPTLVAGISELSEEQTGEWRTFAIMAGRGPWPATKLDKLVASSEGLLDLNLRSAWERLERHPRATLWLSLHRGIAAEPRWDVRVLRVCSLLETVATGAFEQPEPVVDGAGTLLRDHAGKPATTRKARGAIYMLLRRAVDALSIPEDALMRHRVTYVDPHSNLIPKCAAGMSQECWARGGGGLSVDQCAVCGVLP